MGDITAEALQKLREIIKAELEVKTFEIHGRQYANREPVHIAQRIRPTPVFLHTLGALLDFVAEGPDDLPVEDLLTVVASPTAVLLVSKAGSDDNERDVWAKVTLDEGLKVFPFGTFMDPEAFIVALQMLTLDSPDRSEILKLVGSVKGERVIESKDDGISQTVSVRQGVAGTSTYTINNPVTLKPYRTFREIDQPESPFLLRARNGKGEDSLPEFALFEADGGAWRLTAVERIKDYLAGGPVVVIA